ncbi:hypothetical protein BV20DRAFT_944306 [Pilatotrama ljubarskyi]|nr:hypothetical protein BV20DRAFT_944306 [Pilatotrama ljubarskyi]
MARWKISRDLKERCVVLVGAGWKVADVAYALGVSRQSVARWVSREPQGERHFLSSLTTLQGRPRVLSSAILEDLQDLLRAAPSIYLDEIASWLAVNYDLPLSVSTIHRALVALGYTYKKLRKTASQRDELTRAQWKADIVSRFTANQLVFADNILPALSVDGFLTIRIVHAVDSREFYDWIVNDLLPKMNPFPGPNSVLIVDNCRTHKSAAVREAIEAAGELASGLLHPGDS